jgi:hypothetical protein
LRFAGLALLLLGCGSSSFGAADPERGGAAGMAGADAGKGGAAGQETGGAGVGGTLAAGSGGVLAGSGGEATGGAGMTAGGAGAGGMSAGAGGVAGELVVAGMGGNAGGLGGAGMAGAGAVAAVTCNYKPILTEHCTGAGCHSANDLYTFDLTPNDELIARIKDQPAAFSGINCGEPGEPFEECVPSACEIAAPPGALLIDSANPDESWILMKMRGMADGCGDTMPTPPGTVDFSESRRACLEEFFLAVAAEPVR